MDKNAMEASYDEFVRRRREVSWAHAIQRALIRTGMKLYRKSNTRTNVGMTPALALARHLLADPFLFEDEERHHTSKGEV